MVSLDSFRGPQRLLVTMSVMETLVALTHGGDVLAVTRDEHGGSLAGNGIGPGGRAATTFPDGTWVVGGLLPDGADRAVVRDVAGFETEATCRAGAWLAT